MVNIPELVLCSFNSDDCSLTFHLDRPCGVSGASSEAWRQGRLNRVKSWRECAWPVLGTQALNQYWISGIVTSD